MTRQYPRAVHRAVQILCVGLLGAAAQAQEADNPPASDQRSASRDEVAEMPVEEVIVTGERTLKNLMARAETLTLDFYDVLNAAIDEREFRINCQREQLPGSIIRQQVCRPRYIEEEQARQAHAVFMRIPLNEDGERVVDTTNHSAVADMVPYDLGQTAIMQKQQEFNARLLRAVNEDPDLNRAFWELYALKSEIDGLRGSE